MSMGGHGVGVLRAAANLSAVLCLAAAVAMFFSGPGDHPSAKLGMAVPLDGRIGPSGGRLLVGSGRGGQRLRMLAACAALDPVTKFEVCPASRPHHYVPFRPRSKQGRRNDSGKKHCSDAVRHLVDEGFFWRELEGEGGGEIMSLNVCFLR